MGKSENMDGHGMDGTRVPQGKVNGDISGVFGVCRCKAE
jgi:hypothetical protein